MPGCGPRYGTQRHWAHQEEISREQVLRGSELASGLEGDFREEALELHGEAAEGAGRGRTVGFDRFDPGAGRALVEPGEVGFEGVGRALGAGFHGAVVQVADPAGKAEAAGFLAGGITEADALDAA